MCTYNNFKISTTIQRYRVEENSVHKMHFMRVLSAEVTILADRNLV